MPKKTAPKKADKRAQPSDSLLAFGLDEKGRPRGARFSTARDDIVRVAMDLKCAVVHKPAGELAILGAKLPVGRVHASGKAFIPNIRRDLYDKLTAMKTKIAKQERAEQQEVVAENKHVTEQEVAKADTAPGSKAKGALPVDWKNIAVGDMVLAQDSPDEGWWASIIVARDGDLLTLRYRDFPKEPQVVRHISTIGRVHPVLN